MKKLYFLFVMMLAVGTAWSQTTYTWNNGAGGAFGTATNWTPNRTSPATTDILVFNLGATYSVTGVTTQTIGQLQVNAGNVTFTGGTFSQTLTINNGNAGGADLTIANGATLIQAASYENITFGTGASASIAGTLQESGTYNADGTGNATTTVTGTIDNRGTITSNNTARLAFSAGGTYIHAVAGGNIPDATWNNTSTIKITGATSSLPGNFGPSYGHVIWDCAGQTGNISYAANLVTVNGDFSVVNTGGFDIRLKNTGGIASTTTVIGDFKLSGGTVTLDGTSGTHTLAVQGDVNISGGTLAKGGGTGILNFTGNGTFTKTGGTISGAIDINVLAGATVDFGTSVLDGTTATFDLAGTAKLITANPNGIATTGATGSIQVGGARTYSSTADYEFKGAATGVFTTNPTANTVRNLTINNSSANVTLSQALTVTGQLGLTAGAITTTTNLLTIAAGGTTTAATATSFVNGPLAKVGTTAFTFPVGKVGAGFRNIGISAPSVSSTFRAEFFRAGAPAGTKGTGVKGVSGCEYWDLSRTAGTGTARVTLSWESGSACNSNAYVTDLPTLAVGHLTGGTWVNEGQQSTTGNTAAGTITSANVLSTFSPFALISLSGTTNPLPVLFDNVKAFENAGKVKIEWSNLTERDIVIYTVERSSNGRDFTEILYQSPKSNLNDKADYANVDATPLNGANFYRIKVEEINGKIIYSKVLRVEMGTTKIGFSLYPNPVVGKQVTIALTGVKQGQYKVRVINATGQDVYQQTIVNQASGLTQTLQLPSAIKAGVYTMQVSGENYTQNQLFVVQ